MLSRDMSEHSQMASPITSGSREVWSQQEEPWFSHGVFSYRLDENVSIFKRKKKVETELGAWEWIFIPVLWVANPSPKGTGRLVCLREGVESSLTPQGTFWIRGEFLCAEWDVPCEMGDHRHLARPVSDDGKIGRFREGSLCFQVQLWGLFNSLFLFTAICFSFNIVLGRAGRKTPECRPSQNSSTRDSFRIFCRFFF